MIARLIRWSIHNRFLVLLATALVTAWGVYSLRETPLDALPDLSDTQVIIKASYPGKAPQVVEDQVNVTLISPERVELDFQTHLGYYLYRDRFSFAVNGTTVKPATMPPGEVKNDPTFGMVTV